MIVRNNLSIQARMHVDGKDKDFESNETSTDEDLECDDSLADEDGDHDEGPFLSLKSLSDELEASLTSNEALSRITRNGVLQQNTTFWSTLAPSPFLPLSLTVLAAGTTKMSVSLIHLGQRCKGSGVGSGLLRVAAEKCQNEVVIDFDTARLFCHDGRMMLDGRCISCRATVRLTKLLRSCGLEIQDLGKELCTKDGCTRRSFRMSGSCIRHLYDDANAISPDEWGPAKKADMRFLRNVFQSAVRVKWKSSPAYERVQELTHEIAQGKRAGSDLVILDDEWSPGSNQLWEFAMVEKVSGKVLINTRVKHPNGLDHGAFGSASFLQRVGEAKAKRVYSSNSQESNADLLTADETASKIKAAGITSNTVILVWGANRFDLAVLRQYLESAGHYGILPPLENCIPLTQFFRDNLPKKSGRHKGFPLNLEVLFPILFPGHGLIGLNHRALEDCLQTRLILLAFEELCKPVSKRGKAWEPESITTMEQRSVIRWFRAEDHDKPTAGRSNKPARDRIIKPIEGAGSKRKFADSHDTRRSKRTRICRREGFLPLAHRRLEAVTMTGSTSRSPGIVWDDSASVTRRSNFPRRKLVGSNSANLAGRVRDKR